MKLNQRIRDLISNHKKRRRNAIFAQYPAEDFLHNALRFMADNNYDEAYSEVCYALCKAGAELRKDEAIRFRELTRKDN